MNYGKVEKIIITYTETLNPLTQYISSPKTEEREEVWYLNPSNPNYINSADCLLNFYDSITVRKVRIITDTFIIQINPKSNEYLNIYLDYDFSREVFSLYDDLKYYPDSYILLDKIWISNSIYNGVAYPLNYMEYSLNNNRLFKDIQFTLAFIRDESTYIDKTVLSLYNRDEDDCILHIKYNT